MKRSLDKLQNMPEGKKKLTIIIVAVCLGVIGLVTYPLWGTGFGKFGTPSFLKSAANDIAVVSTNIEALRNEAKNTTENLQNQQKNFEENLGPNEFFTNEEQTINDVAINIRKILLDTDKTLVWFRISNLTENTIQLDPASNLEITSGGVAYLPRLLNDLTLANQYKDDQGQVEILESKSMAAGSSLEGYIAFQTVPSASETFSIRYHNVLNKDTLKKWNFTFLFDVEKLKVTKVTETE